MLFASFFIRKTNKQWKKHTSYIVCVYIYREREREREGGRERARAQVGVPAEQCVRYADLQSDN
jgi:hypothetical protein